MGTNTTRLLLWKPDGSPGGDNINVNTDINDNADIIDSAINFTICTSGTRPTGAQRWDGRQIYETDTRRAYMWQQGLGFWMPMLIGRGSGVGPYLLGTSTDTGGEGLNISGSVASAHILRSRVTTEANPRLTVDTDGRMQWGAGGASAVDTNLYRNSANELKTDDALTVVGNLSVTGTAAWNFLATNSPTGTTFTFSSIPATYSHLMMVGSARGTTGATNTSLQMQFNGITTATYDSEQVAANGATIAASELLAQTACFLGEMAASTATAGACGTFVVFIPNYAGTSFWKSWTCSHSLALGTATTQSYSKHWGGHARATAAVASITLFPAAGSFATGSKFSLYGML